MFFHTFWFMISAGANMGKDSLSGCYKIALDLNGPAIRIAQRHVYLSAQNGIININNRKFARLGKKKLLPKNTSMGNPEHSRKIV